MPTVEFFWDVASPYTYLASTQMKDLAARTGATVEYRPFLLGGVFKATGNSMPATVQARAMYMGRDLMRWKARYGVPMKMPVAEVAFPINSVKAMRVACALTEPGQGEAFCHAVMDAYWGQGKNVSEVEVLSEVIAGLGLDPAATLEAATTQPVKDALRANSDDAVAKGAFGAPTFVVDGQLYFGNDRLHFVEAALSG